MACREVVILASDFLFELTNFLREKLYRAATLRADHVVMAATVVLMLIAGNPIVEGYLAGEPAFGEKLQRAVDRGVTDAGVFSLDEAVQFVSGKVIASLQKGAQDRITLGGLLKPDALQVAMEDLLGLPHHLARDRGLVVDALLKHGCGQRVRIPPRHLEIEIHFQDSAQRLS